VHIRLLTEKPICTSSQAWALMRKSVLAADPSLKIGESPADDPLEPLHQLAKHTQKPVILFATNVDGMSYHLARHFLRGVRTLSEERRLVAVLSGESDLHELVHGENSEFSCANQYVLKCYTFEEFCAFLARYVRYLRMEFAAPEDASRLMWEATGGNLYILRIILWSIIQQRTRRGTSPEESISIGEIPSTFKLTGIPGAYGAHIFRHATQLISRDQNCWEKLEKLIDGVEVPVLPYDAPGRLELAGIAVREFEDGSTNLRFSSPMMAAFIKRFYDARRFGDLYASVGQWDGAFKRYSQLEAEERVRPSGIDDRAEVEATIGALCSALYEAVAHDDKNEEGVLPIGAVRSLFAQSCHYILGFREITFWQRDTLLPSPSWRHDPPNSFIPSKEVLERLTHLLPSPTQLNLQSGILESRDSLSKYAIAAVLPGRLHKQAVVIVSDFAKAVVISDERERLIRQVLKHFIRAYEHAIDLDNLQMRSRFQRHYESIISSIFEQLGTHDLNVHNLLAEAAKRLRQLAYSRVLFCLVDKENNAIVGEVDDSDNPNVDVAKLTHWPLDDPTADLQPYIVNTKRPKIITDARNEPLANQQIVRDASMRAEALIPILNQADEVVGTLHIERKDSAVPTPEEVDDLMFFSRQLAIAIEQCERKLQSKQDLHARERLIKRSVAEQTMATTVHNLGTRLGSLYVIHDRYYYLAEKYKELGLLNNEFYEIIDYVNNIIGRANDLLSPVDSLNLRLETVDVAAVIVRTLQTNLPPETWEFKREGELPAMRLDTSRFKTALLELISNSRDAARVPEELMISITAKPSIDYGVEGVSITYRDNGPGIPEEYSGQQIYEDFFSYRPVQGTPSTGIGMGFVKRVVEAHGGSIFYSGYIFGSGHAGAEFTISLPKLEEKSPMEEKTRVPNSNS
jgi:signal transduction histidine kinase